MVVKIQHIISTTSCFILSFFTRINSNKSHIICDIRYLDPKNDLVFKKVFGEHPEILLSFLNELFPLEPDQVITEIEYLPVELVPEIPLIVKNSLMDIRCKDNLGR
jgi:hypothetical protein